MNFFFDANCNVALVKVVRDLVEGHTFQLLKDAFPQDAKDPVWISALAKRDEPWIIVSGDNKRFKNRAKAAVVADSGLHWVALIGKFNQRGFKEQAEQLAAAWPRLITVIEKHEEPCVFKIKLDPSRPKGVSRHKVLVESYKTLRELV